MDSATDMLISQIVVPLIVTGATALGAWLVAQLPGPIRDALTSATHARNVALIANAFDRRAQAVTAGEIRPTSPTVDLTSYVRANLPETVAKVAPSDSALNTMALAALQRAENQAALQKA